MIVRNLKVTINNKVKAMKNARLILLCKTSLLILYFYRSVTIQYKLKSNENRYVAATRLEPTTT